LVEEEKNLLNKRPKLALTRKGYGFALCLMCGGPAVWFAEYEPIDFTLCDACYETATRDDEPDDLDKAVAALKRQLGADEENFVCTDVDGVRHDLTPSGYYITSRPERVLHRILASYPPHEIAEMGFEGCRQYRGYDPIEFLVDEIEHARMMRDGVLDEVMNRTSRWRFSIVWRPLIEGKAATEVRRFRAEAPSQGENRTGV
jgi:hypothetical protein